MDEQNDNEISAELALSEAGFKASVKSRFLSAWDKLGGRKIANKMEPINRELAVRDALTRAELAIIEAAAKKVASDIGADSELAARALSRSAERAVLGQARDENILMLTYNELLKGGSSEESDSSDTEDLSEEFLARFERHISTATTEDAQQRWAMVLAQEVREPGSFDGKSLRIIDEISRETAELFQLSVKYRLGANVPTVLFPETSVQDLISLFSAELIVDSQLENLNMPFTRVVMENQKEFWFLGKGTFAMGIPCERLPDQKGVAGIIWGSGNRPGVTVKRLTPVGLQISQLFADTTRETLLKLGQHFSDNLKANICTFDKTSDGWYEYAWLSPDPPKGEAGD